MAKKEKEIKISFTMEGEPFDLDALSQEERVKLANSISIRMMKAAGYVPVEQTYPLEN